MMMNNNAPSGSASYDSQPIHRLVTCLTRSGARFTPMRSKCRDRDVPVRHAKDIMNSIISLRIVCCFTIPCLLVAARMLLTPMRAGAMTSMRARRGADLGCTTGESGAGHDDRSRRVTVLYIQSCSMVTASARTRGRRAAMYVGAVRGKTNHDISRRTQNSSWSSWSGYVQSIHGSRG